MVGEQVVVFTPTYAYDTNMDEVTTYAQSTVDDVLVDPSKGADVLSNTRLDGTRAYLTLHFPKTFTAPLRGCKVVVRGKEYRVIGDPAPYTDANTPTRWHMPVDVEVVDG